MCMTWRFHFPLRNYDFKKSVHSAHDNIVTFEYVYLVGINWSHELFCLLSNFCGDPSGTLVSIDEVLQCHYVYWHPMSSFQWSMSSLWCLSHSNYGWTAVRDWLRDQLQLQCHGLVDRYSSCGANPHRQFRQISQQRWSVVHTWYNDSVCVICVNDNSFDIFLLHTMYGM